MAFRLGNLKQYWLIGLVVLWVVVAVVFLLIAPKPTGEQRAASTEQPATLESGQPTVLAEDETLTAWVVEVLEEGIVEPNLDEIANLPRTHSSPGSSDHHLWRMGPLADGHW